MGLIEVWFVRTYLSIRIIIRKEHLTGDEIVIRSRARLLSFSSILIAVQASAVFKSNVRYYDHFLKIKLQSHLAMIFFLFSFCQVLFFWGGEGVFKSTS